MNLVKILRASVEIETYAKICYASHGAGEVFARKQVKWTNALELLAFSTSAGIRLKRKNISVIKHIYCFPYCLKSRITFLGNFVTRKLEGVTHIVQCTYAPYVERHIALSRALMFDIRMVAALMSDM